MRHVHFRIAGDLRNVHILIMDTPLAILQFTVELAHLHSMIGDIPKSPFSEKALMAGEDNMAQILST
jgi:hypothetical protein